MKLFEGLMEAIKFYGQLGFDQRFSLEEQGVRVPGVQHIYSRNQVQLIEFHQIQTKAHPNYRYVVCAVKTFDGHKGMVIELREKSDASRWIDFIGLNNQTLNS